MGTVLSDVIEFARSHGGVVTREEAIALGMAETTLRRRVDDGVFTRIRPGVLALPTAKDSFLIDLHAASRKLGAVVSHQSAAYIHDLDRPLNIKLTISVPRNKTKSYEGCVVHQLADLLPHHVAEIDGLRVTTPERTVVDLSAVIGKRHLLRVVEGALSRGLINFDALESTFDEVARRGKPGTALLRKTLEALAGPPSATESELEIRFRALLEEFDLPTPTEQFRPPWLRRVNGRVDFAFLDHKLIVEVDGRRWHAKNEAFETDRLRDNAALAAGWRVLRFTWREVIDRPARVAATVRRTLAVLDPISAVSGDMNPGLT